jgi:hypothetical protein
MVSTVGTMVQRVYGSERFATLVAMNRGTRSYRWGELPIEVRKQSWALTKDEEGRRVVRMQIGPGKSWTVRIRGDAMANMRLSQLERGEAVPLALKVVRSSKRSVQGGPPRKAWFVRISAMFPRKSAAGPSCAENTLSLGHTPEMLLYGVLAGDEDVFEFPGVALRTLIVGGDKADKRRQQEQSVQRGIWSKRKRKRWGKDRSRVCENRNRKITEQIKLAAASLTRWCVSHGVATVNYDVTDCGFLPHCPWHCLKQTVHDSLEREGIVLNVLGKESPEVSDKDAAEQNGSAS